MLIFFKWQVYTALHKMSIFKYNRQKGCLNENGVLLCVRAVWAYGHAWHTLSSFPTSTCTKGSWNCTQNECQTTCHIYGEGHVRTFDGLSYTFDGLCQYSFIEVVTSVLVTAALCFLVIMCWVPPFVRSVALGRSLYRWCPQLLICKVDVEAHLEKRLQEKLSF